MPKFDKMIVSEGRYRIRNPKSGRFENVELTLDDLEQMADTAGKLQSKGYKIPAPWKHDFNIHAFTKLESGDNGLLEDSTKNGGFWDNLRLDVNKETGKTELWGTVEAPGSEDDPNTPAGKIGKTVKETSIYLRRNFDLTDDSGESLKNVPMHIALVTHPIEPGQPNFQPASDGELAIAMSDMMPVTEFGDLTTLLAEFDIFLPANTTHETLVDNLRISLSQLLLVKKREEKEDGPSSNRAFNAEPLMMSNLTPEAIDSIVKSGAKNPATNKPFTAADFETKTDPKVEELQMSLVAVRNTMQDDRRKGYRARVNTLVETGRCDKQFAETNLIPQVESYNLELKDGKVVTSSLDTVLMSLEALPAKNNSELRGTNGGQTGTYGQSFEDYDLDQSGQGMTEEEMKAVAMAMVSN